MLIKLREYDFQKIYVTSDTHFGHLQKFVWESRGYSSPAEHDEQVINGINNRVRSTDILIHLGDFCLNTSIERFEEIISRINCQNIYMLFGNHNNPHEKKIFNQIMMEKKIDGECFPTRYKNVIYYGYYAEAILNGQFTVLCHYPLAVFNEMQHGAWMLCGHSHYNFAPSKADSLEAKILDCGWDGHHAPWSLEEIKEVMSKKQIPKVDHH